MGMGFENQSSEHNNWIEDGFQFHELSRQEYNGDVFSSGEVAHHPDGRYYVLVERDNRRDLLILRSDEAAVMIYVCSILLWASSIKGAMSGDE